MEGKTLINVLLDRSGSMGAIAKATVNMFNEFLQDQKNENGYADLSLIQFSTRYEESYILKNIHECEELVVNETYTPGGMTALNDAIGKSIHILDQHENHGYAKVLFIIITDGEENASLEYSANSIRKMINKHKEKHNWDFIFLGAGIDAYKEGSKFGMSRSKCASFSGGARGMSVVGQTMSSYTTSYRTTGDTSMDVSDFVGDDDE